MKTRILFYSHQSNLAGAPLSLASIASGLPAEYEGWLVTPQQGPMLKKVKCRTKVIGSMFQTIKLIQFINQHNIDIVHANTVLATPAVYAAKMTGKKLVWHIREDLDMFPAKLPQKILRLADKVIVISDSMKKHFHNSNKVIRIYNGIKEQKIKRIKRSQAPKILFAGTLEKRKGVKELLQAIKYLRDIGAVKFKLNIYGRPLPGSNLYFKGLERYVNEGALTNEVSFKGVTNNIIKAISEADIITIPSLAEPFGRVAVEAMLCQKPVVASKCGGLAEIVEHEKTGLLFPAGNQIVLAKQLHRLLKAPQLAKKYGLNGYKRYKQLFTEQKYVQNVIKVYKQLLKD
ncbi:glycosyltransferase family 4 protein [Candidatus Margulisiibacteriota bacterium]